MFHLHSDARPPLLTLGLLHFTCSFFAGGILQACWSRGWWRRTPPTTGTCSPVGGWILYALQVTIIGPGVREPWWYMEAAVDPEKIHSTLSQYLNPAVLNPVSDFVSQGTFGNVWGHFSCHNWVEGTIGVRVLLAPSGEKPGMLLTVLQYTEVLILPTPTPHTERTIWSRMSTVLRLRSPGWSWRSNQCHPLYAPKWHVQPLFPTCTPVPRRQVLSLFLNLTFLVPNSVPLCMWFPLPGMLSSVPIWTLPFPQSSSSSSPVNLSSTAPVTVTSLTCLWSRSSYFSLAMPGRIVVIWYVECKLLEGKS